MTDEQTPAPTPSTEPPPPLAPLVEQASAASAQPPAAPPVAWAPAPAAVVPATGQRTVLAAIAGVLLLIGGILGGLAGLAVAIIGGSFANALGDLVEVPGLNGADAGTVFGGVIAFFGALILIYSVVYLVAGIGVLRNRNWGRVMGIVVGILSGLIWLGSVTTPDQPGVQESIVGSLLAFGVHAYIVVVLLFFWRNRPVTA